MRNFAHTGKRNPLRDRDQILHVVDIRDVITYATFGVDRLRGLGVTGVKFPISPIDLRRRPYNTLALSCECDVVPRYM